MYRLKRKNWTFKDIGFIVNKNDIFSSIDNLVKGTFRINDLEFDYICDNATDEELDILIEECENFSEKRKLLITVNKLIESYETRIFNNTVL